MEENIKDDLNSSTDSKAGVSEDERTWAMLAHISAVAGFVFPFGNVIGPLLIWILKKEELPFVDDQGKEALNFQISITIYVLISSVLVFVPYRYSSSYYISIFALVMTIIGAINAYDGKPYRYPLTIRVIK